MPKVGTALLSLVTVISFWVAPMLLLADEPRRGGILQIALAGDPPSLDMHQEQTFAVDIPLGPVYNTLIVFDPHHYPKIIGDLAKSWTVSDGLPDVYLHAAPGGEVPRWQRADVGGCQGQLGPHRLSARGRDQPRGAVTIR